MIDQDSCIQCGAAMWSAKTPRTSHLLPKCGRERRFEVNEAECVGCNLCVSICPGARHDFDAQSAAREVDARTGKTVTGEYANWTTHPNNPSRVDAQISP
ncbi:4Fe-4S dicluster-binding protein [Comamonas sp. JC664]|uniref:4Fe-4S dicluster-binding protein n=1 Tax=Comamonas sp. JC664 TaxID=2801917 RepID=UPI00361C1D1C